MFNVLAKVPYFDLDVWAGTGPDFIQKSWPLVLFFVWCYSFREMTATASLMLINGVCIYRLYALSKPMNYLKLPKAKMAWGLLGVSYVIGILSDLKELFVMNVKWSESLQAYELDIYEGHSISNVVWSTKIVEIALNFQD